MKKLENGPSPKHVRAARIFVVLGTLLLALACTCPLPPIVVNYPVTVIAPPSTGLPSGGISPETATPTYGPSPTPVSLPAAAATNTPGICPVGIVNASCVTRTPLAPTLSGGGDWGLTESDLEMVGVTETSLFGDIWLEIRNHGPHNFVETLRVFCTGGGILNEGVTLPLPPTDPVNTEDWFGLSIPTGGTAPYVVEALVDLTNYHYGIVCTLDAGGHDPNVSNNSILFALP